MGCPYIGAKTPYNWETSSFVKIEKGDVIIANVVISWVLDLMCDDEQQDPVWKLLFSHWGGG